MTSPTLPSHDLGALEAGQGVPPQPPQEVGSLCGRAVCRVPQLNPLLTALLSAAAGAALFATGANYYASGAVAVAGVGLSVWNSITLCWAMPLTDRAKQIEAVTTATDAQRTEITRLTALVERLQGEATGYETSIREATETTARLRKDLNDKVSTIAEQTGKIQEGVKALEALRTLHDGFKNNVTQMLDGLKTMAGGNEDLQKRIKELSGVTLQFDKPADEIAVNVHRMDGENDEMLAERQQLANITGNFGEQLKGMGSFLTALKEAWGGIAASVEQLKAEGNQIGAASSRIHQDRVELQRIQGELVRMEAEHKAWEVRFALIAELRPFIRDDAPAEVVAILDDAAKVGQS